LVTHQQIQSRKLINDMESTLLSLIVIRSSNVEAAISFYRALGLSFVREQHGSGPVHYSCELSGVVLEIYPAQSDTVAESKAAGSTMLGFKVASIDDTLAKLQALGFEPNAAPKDAEWGRWANVTDPSGRSVQLNQAAK
jgi:lactoylglutathione lyase